MKTFEAGQKVWLRTLAGEGVERDWTYRDGVVTAVGASGFWVSVVYADGTNCTYVQRDYSRLITDDEMVRQQEAEQAIALQRHLMDTVNAAQVKYDTACYRLRNCVRGDGKISKEYLARVEATTQQIDAMISSLSAPATTNQEDPVK